MKNGKTQENGNRNESDAPSQSAVPFIVDTGAKEMQTSENEKFSLSIILLYKSCYLFYNILPTRMYSSLLGIPSMIEVVKSLNLISFKKQRFQITDS